jgi:sorbitol-specific phosphotransferase system component IIBC
LSRQKVHSIEDADTFVETGCSIVVEKWSLVDTSDSFSTTKWSSIEAKKQTIEAKEQALEAKEQAIQIVCSFASIACSFAAIVYQVSRIASSFVHEEAVPRGGNAPSCDESRPSFASKRVLGPGKVS